MTAPSLLVHFDGKNGSTILKDSSPNALTFTSFNGASISTSKSKFGNSSIYFNGTSQYISAGPSSASNFSSLNFNVSFWAYHLNNSASSYIGDWAGGSHFYWLFSRTDTSSFIWASSSTGLSNDMTIISASYTPTLNEWTHFSVDCSGGNLKIFANGRLIGSGTINSIVNADTKITIGRQDDNGTGYPGGGSAYFNGYIDEVCIRKYSLWQSEFTPPSRPWSGADLLLHFDGQNGTNAVIDSSDNSITLTPGSAFVCSNAQSKFGGSSGRFDGTTNSIITSASNPAWDFGTNDFTIEFQLYLAADTVTSGTALVSIASSYDANNSVGYWQLYLDGDSSTTGTGLVFMVSDPGSTSNTKNYTSNPVSKNVWHHIAVSVKSGATYIFIDGVQQNTSQTTTGGGFTGAYGGQLSIGGLNSGSVSGYTLNGYIDEFVITKGAALYTSNFTPKVSPFGQTDPSLLLHLDGVSGATSIIDSSVNALAATANGSAKISLDQSKFGGSSLYLNGSTSSYVSVANTPAFDFDNGDFTIDAWAWTDPSQVTTTVLASASTTSSNGWSLYLKADGTNAKTGLGFSARSADGSITADCAPAYDNGAWHHYAVSVSGGIGGTIRLFIDGTMQSSTTSTSGTAPTSCVSNGNPMTIGIQNVSDNPYPHFGYIDEVRVTKGVALYTNNFEPPNSPYFAGDATASTLLYTGQSNQSASAATITILLSATSGQGNQSIAAIAAEQITGYLNASQAQTIWSAGNLVYPTVLRTKQSDQTESASLSSAILSSIHTAQIQSIIAFGNSAERIYISASSGQSNQYTSITIVPLITTSTSTSQRNQTQASVGNLSYFQQGAIIRGKTTFIAKKVNKRWIMDKIRRTGDLSD